MSKTSLDRIDSALIAALQNNARMSNKELAAHVHLAPSSCHGRVRRLIDDGVLRGFHAEVDPEALGIGIQALLFVRMGTHSRETVRDFQLHISGLREVLEVIHLAGAMDFVVRVAVPDASALRDLVVDAFAAREEVAHIETSLIFGHERSSALPDFVTE
jgi:DNA-binding Lrp family transcriptional regulator